MTQRDFINRNFFQANPLPKFAQNNPSNLSQHNFVNQKKGITNWQNFKDLKNRSQEIKEQSKPLKNSVVTLAMDLMEIERKKKERIRTEREKQNLNQKLSQLQENSGQISKQMVKSSSISQLPTNGVYNHNTFQRLSPYIINQKKVSSIDLLIRKEQQIDELLNKQQSQQTFQPYNSVSKLLISNEDQESTLNSPVTIFSKKSLNNNTMLFRDGNVKRIQSTDANTLFNSVLSPYKKIDLTINEETFKQSPPEAQQKMEYENIRIKKIREEQKYIEVQSKLQPIMKLLFSKPKDYYSRFPRKANYRILHQGADFNSVMIQQFIAVCSQCLELLEDSLSICADLVKKTLDSQFGKDWIVLFICIDKKRRKQTKVINVQNRSMQFSANYSLEKKYDFKLIFEENFYVNIFKSQTRANDPQKIHINCQDFCIYSYPERLLLGKETIEIITQSPTLPQKQMTAIISHCKSAIKQEGGLEDKLAAITDKIKQTLDSIFNPFWTVVAVSYELDTGVGYRGLNDQEITFLVDGDVVFYIFKNA